MAPSTITDDVLVERAAHGDEIAFSELVTRHYRRAVRVAYGLVKHRQDAEDIAQVAFTRVYQRLPDFQGQSAFYTWLYRVVVNASIDQLRKRKREKRIDVDDDIVRNAQGLGAELWPVFPAHDPAAAHTRRALSAKLHRAFEALSPIHRSVIVLREVEGQSYEEIAETLSIKRGTVMSRLFNARQALQEALSQQDLADVVVPHPQRSTGAGQ